MGFVSALVGWSRITYSAFSMLVLFFRGLTRKLMWVVLVSFVTMPMCSFMRVLVVSMFGQLRVMRILCFWGGDFNLLDSDTVFFV